MSVDDDAAVVANLAEELQAMERPMELRLAPTTVLQLAGLLQFAGRHPDLSPSHRRVIETFLAAARTYFADAPTVLELLRRGDDPKFDVVLRSPVH